MEHVRDLTKGIFQLFLIFVFFFMWWGGIILSPQYIEIMPFVALIGFIGCIRTSYEFIEHINYTTTTIKVKEKPIDTDNNKQQDIQQKKTGRLERKR